MEKTKVIYCETKKSKDDYAVKTKLTLDLSLLSPEDIEEYAFQAIVIKWQGGQRRKKAGVIPTSATYTVPKPGTRQAASLEDMISGLTKEQAMELIMKLQAKAKDDEVEEEES